MFFKNSVFIRVAVSCNAITYWLASDILQYLQYVEGFAGRVLLSSAQRLRGELGRPTTAPHHYTNCSTCSIGAIIISLPRRHHDLDQIFADYYKPSTEL